MAIVAGAYCAVEDMRTGDIATPQYTSKEQYIQNAAKEIDAALGHLYVTPIVIDVAGHPEYRPAVLFLEKINWLLASGRFILDVAAASEMDTLNAYGKRMLDEANAMLKILTTEEIVLAGAPHIGSDDDEKNFTGPAIFNEDQYSLVESFYQRGQSPLGVCMPQVYIGQPPVLP